MMHLGGPHSEPVANIKECKFSPYQNNGGTTLGIAGEDFCIVAADTRMSQGYSINSRYVPKIIKLTDKCVLASAGMQADIQTLHKTLVTKLQWYEHQNNKIMSTTAMAQNLGNTLYYKRFFPYYTFNVLGGLDEKGKGCVFSYDAVGSFERSAYASSGTGQTLIQPVLDNQVGKKHQLIVKDTTLSQADALDFVKDAFTSAGERDIYTGDWVDIYSIDAKGVRYEKFELRFD